MIDHISIRCADLAESAAFYDAVLDHYGAFVRDPDGNNIEAVCHTP